MAHEPHVPSYYAATAAAPPERPALAGDLRADVCVVGAGFTGLSAALNLAERGYRVAVLEANRVGWGASGRNGGQIGSGFAADMAWLEGWAGRAAARGLFTLAEEAKAIIRERVERHGISCDLKWGTFHAASKARHMPGLAAKQAHWSEAYGYQGLRLAETPDEAHRYVNSPSYIGGIFDPSSGHLHPLKYCQGLARAAEEAGATIFEGSPVIGLETGTGGAGQVAAKTGCGCVKADFLLLCGNAYLGDLVPEIRRVIAPLSSYIVATRPLGEDKAADVIPADCAVVDSNHILSYYRLSADRRMLFGGRVGISPFGEPDPRRTLAARMAKLFPQIADADIEFDWGGYVAMTWARVPHVGRLGGRVYFAHGYSGDGVAMTGLVGRVLAEAVAGQAERFDLFAHLPHRGFPGGRLLQRPALVLGLLWYRLCDLMP
ncbi:MAG: FAD-binding oxidoreductase [Kiloniellales bacterium]